LSAVTSGIPYTKDVDATIASGSLMLYFLLNPIVSSFIFEFQSILKQSFISCFSFASSDF